MINHLEREYIFACIQYKKAKSNLEKAEEVSAKCRSNYNFEREYRERDRHSPFVINNLRIEATGADAQYRLAKIKVENAQEDFKKKDSAWFATDFLNSTPTEWRELCIAHPEYKSDIYKYFGFTEEVKK